MAAGITEKDSMFYVREAPWHGLGVRDPQAIDFDERDLIDFIGFFCSDCKERMLSYHRGGIRAAVERMKEKQKTLQLLDKKDREALSQVEEGPECREL